MSQRQSGGDNSANVQAAGDVIIHEGPSVEEVREIAMDVFHRNFLELRGVAEDVARGRAEEITEKFLRRLEERAPEAVKASSDPDFQRSLFNAQKEFACSGEPDLEEVLVDLLVDRADHADHSLQSIVLNEAITSVPKLSLSQRRALAICFLARHARYTRLSASVEEFYSQYLEQLLAVGEDLPTHPIAFQHIEYVGAGSMSVASITFEEALRHSAIGWFTCGFTVDEVPENLHWVVEDNRLVMPCLRDSERLQLRQMAQSPDARPARYVEALHEHTAGDEVAGQLLNLGAMSPEQVREDLKERISELEPAVNAWNTSDLKSLTLTSVGIAIGHAYWMRASGNSAPLDIWISE